MVRIRVPKKGSFTCNGRTAEEAIAYLRQVLDEPWHGNQLLSCGPQKLENTQQLHEFGADFVFANYSPLSSQAPISIAETELRGITIAQLSALLDFVEDIVDQWCDAHHLAYGQPLSFEAFNLYHANFWVIGPATAGHGRGGCSYVELVATSAQIQRPLWFVSHAWLEPVCKFVACLKHHASLRELSEHTAYWVCAYANNQHQLQEEICHNPRKTSFYRAIKSCAGVLLVLDQNATPFTRIWCCFEESIAVEERNQGSSLLLDVAATEHGRSHVITDGLVGEERRMMPLLGFLAKSRREAEFPTEILEKGLDVDIANAMASEASDKRNILNSIVLPRAGTKLLQREAHATHESYDAVGRALAGHFALASWFSSVAHGLDTSRLLTALHRDDQRRVVQLSLTGCCKFDDAQLGLFLQHLPPRLQVLRLDLGFTAVEHVQLNASALPLTELQELSLRFTKTPLRQVMLRPTAMPKLRSLQLWLSHLPELEELQLDDEIAAVRELVLHVHSCPKLQQSAKQTLYDSVHRCSWRRRDKWVSIEGVEPAFQVLRAKTRPSKRPKPGLEALKCQEVNEEMPFPCSQKNCVEFHANLHGFCNKHRFNHIWRKACDFLFKSFQRLELTFLLSIQAAAEIQSRALLTLILLSLLPVTCIFLAEITGISGALICVTFLVVAVGTCVLTARRLDAMQQMIFNGGLETEAKYFQVLQPQEDLEAESEHLVQVKTLLNTSSDDSRQQVPHVPHSEGMKGNYMRSRRHANSFQREVWDRLAHISSDIFVEITPLAELDDKEAVDILHCDVWCDTLQQVQQAWETLQGLDVQIVGVQDLFAVASSRKCIRVVLSLDDSFATVFLLEKSLSCLPARTGALDVASSLGLLDKIQVSSWETAPFQRDFKIPACVLLSTFFLRLVALCLSGTVAFSFHAFYYYGRGESGGWWSLPTFARALPFWTCAAVLLWEMGSCCCRCRHFKFRPRPTQAWYRKYLGIQGSHYAFKVAALQMITVLIQGLAKANLFGIIQVSHSLEDLRSSAAVWCFLGLLLCNILFPAFVFAVPNAVFSRVLAALMDAVLDSGYMITTLLIYIQFASQNVEAILMDFLNYSALYTCAAHVLCVCRSLETADWNTVFHLPRTEPIWGVWKRLLFSIAYVLSLVVLAGWLFGGVLLGSKEGAGFCPPCQCSRTGPSSIVLERCVIPRGYVAQAASPLKFNLTNRSITDVLPDAFWARGVHQPVEALSLRGNHLTELPDGLFVDLLEPMDRWYYEFGIIDLAHNRLTALPSNLFQIRSSKQVHILTLDLEGNKLQELPPKVFDGLEVFELRLQNNHLTQLHPESFTGLTLSSRRLDLSGQKLHELPPRVFDGLKLPRKLRSLDLHNNHLTQLHPECFTGLNFFNDYGHSYLDLSGNKLHELPSRVFDGMKVSELRLQNNHLLRLPPKVFEGLKVRELRLENNSLAQLHPQSFHGLELPKLDLSGQKLSVLPPRGFEGLVVRQLFLQNNGLTELHPESFEGLRLNHSETWYSMILDLSGNKLQELPPKVFEGLEVAQLRLQNNHLLRLPPKVFEGLKVRELRLENNSLTQLYPESFRGLTLTSRRLDLSGQKLHELPPRVFDGLKLRSLDLHNNGLAQLHPQSLRGLDLHGASYLDLSSNKLQELPPKVFEGLNVRTLHLQNNSLQALPPKWDLAVKELNLEENQLTELDEDVFYDSGSGCYFMCLKTLNLAGNQLATLPGGIFNRSSVALLRNLQLQRNQLARLPRQIFQSLRHLEMLNLSHNKLSALDAQMFDLPKLTTLDLRGNPLSNATRVDLARLKVETLFMD